MYIDRRSILNYELNFRDVLLYLLVGKEKICLENFKCYENKYYFIGYLYEWRNRKVLEMKSFIK